MDAFEAKRLQIRSVVELPKEIIQGESRVKLDVAKSVLPNLLVRIHRGIEQAARQNLDEFYFALDGLVIPPEECEALLLPVLQQEGFQVTDSRTLRANLKATKIRRNHTATSKFIRIQW